MASEAQAAKPHAAIRDAAADTGGSQLRFVSHQPTAPETEQPERPAPTIERLPPPLNEQHERPHTVNAYPIDLPTALQLADAENLQVALAREQIRLAYANQAQAKVLWLPSLRAGVHWNKHDGPLQDSRGDVIDVSRSSLYSGMGAQAVGAGSPTIPGVWANFHLADAIFQPLAARQRAASRSRAAIATRNNVLLEVSLAYLELLRAVQDLRIAEDMRDKVGQLADLTSAYARSGQGLQSDYQRMRVELMLRENDLQRSREAVRVAGARLAQLLRLDPTLCLEPLEPAVVAIELIPCEAEPCDLVTRALSSRPELAENRFLVGEAIEQLRRQRYAPLVPSLVLGASYGGYGGGPGDTIANYDDRVDLDATAYWEIRNLGFGETAARSVAQSQVRQARLRQLATLDLVAREVVEAHAQVWARRPQIALAEQGVAAATESHRLNLVRIQEAQGLPIEALQSAQALLQARRDYLRALIDYNVAQFTLQRALGWPMGPL